METLVTRMQDSFESGSRKDGDMKTEVFEEIEKVAGGKWKWTEKKSC